MQTRCARGATTPSCTILEAGWGLIKHGNAFVLVAEGRPLSTADALLRAAVSQPHTEMQHCAHRSADSRVTVHWIPLPLHARELQCSRSQTTEWARGGPSGGPGSIPKGIGGPAVLPQWQ